jgi:hypothetical protein
MDLESLATHEGFDFLKAAIRSTYGKAKRRRLIAEAIRELLALDPDIDAAEARLRAAKALGLTPDDLELRADRLLASARCHRPAESKTQAPGKGPKRKTTLRIARRKVR